MLNFGNGFTFLKTFYRIILGGGTIPLGIKVKETDLFTLVYVQRNIVISY